MLYELQYRDIREQDCSVGSGEKSPGDLSKSPAYVA